MTFESLQEQYSWTTLVREDWHEHENGGGWVYKNASVHKDAFLGPKAVVWGGTIRGGTIRGGTIWGGTIRGGTIRGGTIEGGTIWGGTIWGGTIEGGIWKHAPLYIVGSRHDISNAKPGHLRIGCQCQPFKWWLTKEAEKFARDNDYDDAAIEEYRHYIKLFIEVGK